MEIEKSKGNFSFGFGSVTTAGAGSVDKAVDAPKIPKKHNTKAIARSAANAAIAIGLLAVKSKLKKRKK